ncbi:MAG: ATP-dependent RNA helicase HrpA [Steroidobacteraceae bacterium]|nr:ATP-dependent RNA helicase HrpA [Steroidobacteraceae bacterium]
MGEGQAGPRLSERLASLRTTLGECQLRDRRRLAAVLGRIARRGAALDLRELERLEGQVRASAERVAARRASLPAVHFDESLPVHARRAEIAAAIQRSPVTIVSGATGSGKSTQLPKICLDLGRGVAGMIGHTQPRRIAAQTLAYRVSAELGTTPGDLVGYQVRFVDRTGPRTLVKLMTDGLLLRELEADPLLERYDTLILDEAHERNLNVDFLLGVCRQLVQRRADLRVIVTSATIETRRFAEYFGGAAVIDVEGRSHPVEVRYRPLSEEETEAPSLPEAIAGALDELRDNAQGIDGDALVFLPGERQIADTRDFLGRGGRLDWDVFPLYARLSAAEQEKVFEPHPRRRVVLATNVAETSLTIPGVRFVVDAGLARVSRYSPRAKFQRLPIEPVSRASAEQRKGRCGRLGEGICVRLYSEEDFASRPEYTEPEILRTNLASLILQMAALGLGAPEDFPFVDPPDTRLLNDGYRLLQELSAVDGDRRITRLGRQMAALPVDPRLARILLEAGRQHCLSEALVIAAFLSIQDPRERPADKSEAADQAHALFADERSDFIGVLNLWRAAREQSAAGTRALRRWCKEHFLSFVRVREWYDLHEQLAEITTGQGLERNPDPAPTNRLHQSILAGFLGGIGVLDEARSYLGARDTRFVIAPGTPLAKRTPHWIVAASLVETQRLYARMVAQVQPSWIESAGAHLVRRTYAEAQWDAGRGMVMARETVSLYGRVLSSGRQVNFATIDPALARRLFVEEALVRGQSTLRSEFLERNAGRRAELERLEARLRRRDLVAADQALVDFYLERIPADVASTRAFERWWRAEQRRHPDRLDVPEDVLLAGPAPVLDAGDHPDHLDVDGNQLPLSYRFDPTDPDDGVTLDVPLPLLGSLPARRIEWLVPGYLQDKLVALLRGLPKDVRRELVPIPDAALRLRSALEPFGAGSLFERLAERVTAEAGARVDAAQLAAIPLSPWLRMNVRVLDGRGQEIRRGRDLDALRQELRVRAAHAARPEVASAWEREGVKSWDFGDLPGDLRVSSGPVTLRMYPGIEDLGSAVRLRLFPDAAAATLATVQGVVRLAALALPQQHDLVARQCAADRELALLAAAGGFDRRLFAEVADRALADALRLDERHLPRAAADFAARIDAARADVAAHGEHVARAVKGVLFALKEARAATAPLTGPAFAAGRESIGRQLESLLAPGWVRATPAGVFSQLPKYVRAVARRAQRLREDANRDRRLEAEVAPFVTRHRELCVRAGPAGPGPELERLRWMIEEFRLSLHAQDLRTLGPISAKRLDAQLAKAREEVAGG